MIICSVAGCVSVAATRGWCEKHYRRWKRHGDPLAAKKRWRCSTDPVTGVKVCRACNAEKSISFFAADSRSGDGVRSQCKECISAKERAARDPEMERLRGRRYRLKNADKIRARVRKWRAENAERFALSSKAWRASRPEKMRQKALRSYEKNIKNPKFRLQSSVRAMVHAKITRESKGGRRTFSLLGYSVDELRARLESRFAPGMSWENYGRDGWHIDHIRPLSSFTYSTPDCPDFKEAWALSNLQPLWAIDNFRKHAKMPESIDCKASL